MHSSDKSTVDNRPPKFRITKFEFDDVGVGSMLSEGDQELVIVLGENAKLMALVALGLRRRRGSTYKPHEVARA